MSSSIKPVVGTIDATGGELVRRRGEYAELQVTSNFSFLRGASHPEELVHTAASLGYRALALTDHNSLAGVVRAHIAAKEVGLQFVVGASLSLEYTPALSEREGASARGVVPAGERSTMTMLAYPTSREGYAALCRMLTVGKRRAEKGGCTLTLEDLHTHHRDLALVVVPPHPSRHYEGSGNIDDHNFLEAAKEVRDRIQDRRLLSIALSHAYTQRHARAARAIEHSARYLGVPLVATNDVYYHIPARRPLQDVVSCIRHGCTVQQAGFRLFENAERHLKPIEEMARLFAQVPGALSRSLEIAEMTAGFSLDQLRYEYPREVLPEGKNATDYLAELTWRGASERYPHGIPEKVRTLLQEELHLIEELHYERYFLTCYDIVRFARARQILCQGRGAAANSAVCFSLGITSVDPAKIELLFARFVSKERNEPPDIDIDFEHERREEVIQYIYERYGRDRAGLVAEVVTFRQRSAVREVGKALGLSLEVVDTLAKSIHRWTDYAISAEDLRACGLNPFDATTRNVLALAQELIGFPRHLSQHVGGFIISERALCETVPILNAAMEDRTIIEWDKDDIEALGMLKIDVLALGMLTCVRKALGLINARRARTGADSSLPPLTVATLPAEDPAVYDMVCRSDTVGVFQIESRAQMSMLPRLKPRCFYDLVIEVAIVRPGPIQGNMVHPYLRRRAGLERAHYPDERVREVLGKTMGVPIFQEQAMRLVIVLAGFSPGEAEQLRRAMQAWKRNKWLIASFRDRIVVGMKAKGYTEEFADTCVSQIKGFSEYGFPESHAASFALLVYASAWIKCHYPGEFAAALLNSQPMGFYAPAQIIGDAKAHGVIVHPIDVNKSAWDCTMEEGAGGEAVRLGFRLIRGLHEEQAKLIATMRAEEGEFVSLLSLWNRAAEARQLAGGTSPGGGEVVLRKHTLITLARADAFRSLGLSPREALWEIRALPDRALPLDRFRTTSREVEVVFPPMSRQQEMFQDYGTTGLSLKAHPLEFLRSALRKRGVLTAAELKKIRKGDAPSSRRYLFAGAAIVRQRPGTAKGVLFLSLEDETGIINLIVRPAIFDRFSKILMSSAILLADGTLERTGEVVYLNVVRVESLDGGLRELDEVELPSLSYSY